MEARVGDRPLRPLHSRKGLWLLALLALRAGREVDRDWLAAVLWLDSDQPRGRRNLRQSLSDLRDALGPEGARLQAVGARGLRLEPEGTFIDVREFDAALGRGDAASLATAAALYRGPLLEGCAEEWCLPERRQKEEACVAALSALAAAATDRGEPRHAAVYLRRAAAVDPYREDLQRRLMEALAAGGSPVEALLVYRGYRELLRREMAAEPSEETTALFRRLREESRAAAPGTAPAPPGKRLPVRRSLPLPLTELIGREQAVLELAGLLAPSGPCRLLTLTGVGGIGKTRLGLQVARELDDQFTDGACLVELDALADPALVPHSVAAALSLTEAPSGNLLESLVRSLRESELLLMLDNCEHLATACGELARRILADCPAVRILATSREPLGLAGETAWLVPSLEIPGSTDLPAAMRDAVSYFMGFDAVRLFVERARQADRGFHLSSADASTVAEICRRLDGIPLAVELAAARARAMPLSTLAARLDDRFRLLTGGSRAALPRRQTLRGALDWSYDLLSEPERRLLRRLSVFAGGWTLEAAETVCPDPDEDRAATLVLLTALVDRSLVLYAERGGTPRYRFFESLRQYAAEQLSPLEADAARRRHRGFFLALAERAEPHLTGPDQAAWLDRLEAEHDNLRAALDAAPAEPEQSLRLAAVLWRFWLVRGHLGEGRERLHRALAMAPESTATRARALHAAGGLAYRQADYAAGRVLSEQSLEIWRKLGDQRGMADSLNNLGMMAYAQEEYDEARRYYEESLALRREAGDRAGVAASLNNLGAIAYGREDYAAARTLWEESGAVYRELEDTASLATSLNNLGMAASAQEDAASARERYEESLALRRRLGDRLGIASSLHLLGNLAREAGDHSMAASLYRDALVMRRELGDRWGIAGLLEQLAKVAAEATADPPGACRAARLFGAAEALREQIGAPRSRGEEQEQATRLDRLRERLGEAALSSAWLEGRSLTMACAVDEALAQSAEPGTPLLDPASR